MFAEREPDPDRHYICSQRESKTEKEIEECKREKREHCNNHLFDTVRHDHPFDTVPTQPFLRHCADTTIHSTRPSIRHCANTTILSTLCRHNFSFDTVGHDHPFNIVPTQPFIRHCADTTIHSTLFRHNHSFETVPTQDLK